MAEVIGEKFAWLIKIPKSTVVGTEIVDKAIHGDKVYVQLTKVDEGSSVSRPKQSFVLSYKGLENDSSATEVFNTQDMVTFSADIHDSIVPQNAKITLDFQKLIPQFGSRTLRFTDFGELEPVDSNSDSRSPNQSHDTKVYDG